MLSEAFSPDHREDARMPTQSSPSTAAMSACPFQARHDADTATALAAAATPPLLDPALRMRPPGEPLPAPLREHGGALAGVFGRWLRQRDDAAHGPEKAALTRALIALSEDDIRRAARRQASIGLMGGWEHWHWVVPSCTVASLLGMAIDDPESQRRLHRGLRAMAAGLAPQATAREVHAGGEAVDALLRELDDAERRAPDAPLQWTLLHHAAPARWSDRATFTANRLSLIWQSHEAGAALLGHALLAWRSTGRPPAREELLRIARDGGAVRLTRRFDARKQPPAPLVVPLAGTDFPFGDGAHRCPGQGPALSIAHAALDWLAEQAHLRLPTPGEPLSLANMDIPQFQSSAHEEPLA